MDMKLTNAYKHLRVSYFIS